MDSTQFLSRIVIPAAALIVVSTDNVNSPKDTVCASEPLDFASALPSLATVATGPPKDTQRSRSQARRRSAAPLTRLGLVGIYFTVAAETMWCTLFRTFPSLLSLRASADSVSVALDHAAELVEGWSAPLFFKYSWMWGVLDVKPVIDRLRYRAER
ncbi:hypothetical protein GSI_13217 [Ganoderma sinense ZZ0214-1]|uniref:Uncharacterized protein n=1 Tax=Ganoderma sinense ZZ0214-1 TaxID=1077348 RepID=A0A2G8RVH5_9APHY|nr:hypothetical protein GSI_13217 [Ganoderma sinense ZZ0214-1]